MGSGGIDAIKTVFTRIILLIQMQLVYHTGSCASADLSMCITMAVDNG
jgi:hypothetical protein